jgi:D-psicose/D-tagatose/L-ribulose 3-epimerase
MSVQIGINTWTWVAPFTTTEARTLFPKIKAMGYDIVEFPIEDPAQVDGKELRSLLQDHGLNSTVCGAFGPGRDLGHDDPQITQQSLDYIHTCLQICEQAGARLFVGPMYSEVGKARQLPPDERKREFERAASGLRQAAVMAGDHGITLGIEPLNRFETDMINTAAQAIALTDAIDHPSARIHLDTFHMNIEEDSIYQAIRAVGNRLCHIHACENHRGVGPVGSVTAGTA